MASAIILSSLHIFTKFHVINSFTNRFCFTISPTWPSNLLRIAGKFMGRFGTTLFMRIGLGVMFIAFVGLSFIEAQWSPYLLASVLFLYGIGGGIFNQQISLQSWHLFQKKTRIHWSRTTHVTKCGNCLWCSSCCNIHEYTKLFRNRWTHPSLSIFMVYRRRIITL